MRPTELLLQYQRLGDRIRTLSDEASQSTSGWRVTNGSRGRPSRSPRGWRGATSWRASCGTWTSM